MELLPGFRPIEVISVIFGIVSMILAWLSFRRAERSERQSERAEDRAIQTDERVREFAFAQRKADALALIVGGESALMSAKRKLMALRDKAMEAHAKDIAVQAEAFADRLAHSTVALHGFRDELNAMKSVGRTHEQLLEFVETKISAIRALTDPTLINEEVALFVDPAENHIRVVGLHKEVAEALKRRELNANES
jgi:hypothetical protein